MRSQLILARSLYAAFKHALDPFERETTSKRANAIANFKNSQLKTKSEILLFISLTYFFQNATAHIHRMYIASARILQKHGHDFFCTNLKKQIQTSVFLSANLHAKYFNKMPSFQQKQLCYHYYR